MWYDPLRPHVWLLRAVPIEIQRRIAAYARLSDRERRSPLATIARDIVYAEIEEGVVILARNDRRGHVFFISERNLTHIPQLVRHYWTRFLRLVS